VQLPRVEDVRGRDTSGRGLAKGVSVAMGARERELEMKEGGVTATNYTGGWKKNER